MIKYRHNNIAFIFVVIISLFQHRLLLFILTYPQFYENYYEIEKWNYDLVTMAQHEVRKYEKKIASQIRHQKKVKEAIREFEEWDGISKIN